MAYDVKNLMLCKVRKREVVQCTISCEWVFEKLMFGRKMCEVCTLEARIRYYNPKLGSSRGEMRSSMLHIRVN